MSSILVINAAGRETRVALVENGHIAEFYLERKKDKGIVGNIYKGRVVRVLPGMQAAFVDIGLEKAAFLYVNDVVYDPDFAKAQFELTEGEHDEDIPDVPEYEHTEEHHDELEIHEAAPGEIAPPEGQAVRRTTQEIPAVSAPAPVETPAATVDAPAALPTPPTGTPPPVTVGSAEAFAAIAASQAEAPPAPAAPAEPAAAPVTAPQPAAAAEPPPSAAVDSQQVASGEEPAAATSEQPPSAEPAATPEAAVAAAPTEAAAPVAVTEPASAAAPGAPATAPEDKGERRAPKDQRHRDKHARRRDEKRDRKDRDRSDREEKPRGDRKTPRIEELLKVGQEVVVQASKDPIGTKGARLSSHISIPGRHLVFMPTVDHIGISRRISNEKERRRLRDIVERLRPPGTGFIVRTVAENVPQEKLESDIRFLIEVWNEVVRRNEKRKGPGLLHPDLDLILRATRDLFAHDVEKLVVDEREEYERILRFVEAQDSALRGRVVLHDNEEPVFDAYGIEQELKRATQRKVWLKSGGYLIMDQAEALTAIDVNSGRYVGKKSLEETITKINVEAAREIVYQLRLRNIGGIIICDFIDMEKPQNRDKVFKTLQEALGRDKAKTNVLRISELGLVEMTRKRVRESIGRMLHEDCSYCDGKGYVKTVTTLCYEIFREIRREAPAFKEATLVINCHQDVARVLQGEERDELRHLMDRYNKSIQVKAQQNYHREQFDIYGRPAQQGSQAPSGGSRERDRDRDRDRNRGGGRQDRAERQERADRSDRQDRPDKQDRPDRPDRDRPDRERPEREERRGGPPPQGRSETGAPASVAAAPPEGGTPPNKG